MGKMEWKMGYDERIGGAIPADSLERYLNGIVVGLHKNKKELGMRVRERCVDTTGSSERSMLLTSFLTTKLKLEGEGISAHSLRSICAFTPLCCY